MEVYRCQFFQSCHFRQKSGEDKVKWYNVFVDNLMMELQVSWKVPAIRMCLKF